MIGWASKKHLVAPWVVVTGVFLMLSGCGATGDSAACPAGWAVGEKGCERDLDRDGIANTADNCPDVANVDQQDTNANGIGDACEDEVKPEPRDTDGDGVADALDNCPNLENPDQADVDDDGIGDACASLANVDEDGDGVADGYDNCPHVANGGQQDLDADGEGDACEEQDGTLAQPIIIPTGPGTTLYADARDTRMAPSDVLDAYPPFTQNEAGPEWVYVFRAYGAMQVTAWIDDPEPAGVDVDVHLLHSTDPTSVIARGNTQVDEALEDGLYYLVLDTFVSESFGEKPGAYHLHVMVKPLHAGTLEDLIPVGVNLATPLPLPYGFTDTRDTSEAQSNVIDTYPPFSNNESGPEYVYGFTVDQEVYLSASLVAPEPIGVDIDLQLLSSLSPLTTVARHNRKIYATLPAGTYYLVLDTFDGAANAGLYTLNLTITSTQIDPDDYFNAYVLKAVDYLTLNYGLLGYDSAVLTHDVEYGPWGTITRSGGARTMCVAGVMEVILTAMQLYAEDTGQAWVWNHLPVSSWRYLSQPNIRAHLWVNYDIDAWGSADALRHFGMGQNIPFDKLRPGSFINLNRTNGTGHAVIFMAFIDADGNEYETYNDKVVGFLYFGAQGGYDVGAGGLDYRYAVFSQYGALTMPYKRDLGIIASDGQYTFNTGMMLHPSRWLPSSYGNPYLPSHAIGDEIPVSSFDEGYFTGSTGDGS